jgi:TPR repeat protein
MPSDVPVAFFSYSREDSVFVLKLAKDLRAAGANVWLDQLDIKLGDSWDKCIQNAIAICPCMLVILSPSSVNSRNVMDEVSVALEKNRTIIPVLYRECEIPIRLHRMQRVDFRSDYSEALKLLLAGLAEKPVPTSVLIDRAVIQEAVAKASREAIPARGTEKQVVDKSVMRKHQRLEDLEMTSVAVAPLPSKDEQSRADEHSRREHRKLERKAAEEEARRKELEELLVAQQIRSSQPSSVQGPMIAAILFGAVVVIGLVVWIVSSNSARSDDRQRPPSQYSPQQSIVSPPTTQMPEPELPLLMDQKWAETYRKAFRGDSFAMRQIGNAYADGDGALKSPKDALAWYRKSAEAGDGMSMFLVGEYYETGKGVNADIDQAIVWYRKAAHADPLVSLLAKNALRRLGASTQ